MNNPTVFDLLEYDRFTQTFETVAYHLPWVTAAHSMRDRMDIVREDLEGARLQVWPANTEGVMCAQIGGSITEPEFEWLIRPAL
ncbi:hypothetical protein [Nocardia sp. NBC_01327]|uniref:hypothetical protein n=1 Tax=Nocardia sp. NBC_01327 TaxID=2903593 RepID=UPI002E1575DB|nr:hypothetical protein OG326_23535 [Nocardia sp. NBC_01327]